MLDKKVEAEFKKIMDVAQKKGSVNEDDIYYRILKYDILPEDIHEFIEKLENLGIKVIRTNDDEDLGKEDFSDLIPEYGVDDPVKIQQPAVVHQRNYNHHHETKNHTDQLSRLQRSFCTSHQQHSDSADHQKPDDQPEIIIFQSVKFKHVKILYPFWILTVYLL